MIESLAGFSLHQQRRPSACRCPLAAGFIKRVVDPRKWAPGASEVIYCLQFPVRTGLPWVAFELKKRQFAG